MNNIIFHVPYFVDENRLSGSSIRPMKLLQGFKDIGYNVDVVMGYGSTRKESIAKIKQKIEQGTSYDFCYSESSTMPTLLTEKNHLPSYPFLDFDFFKFLKSKGVKIGLFYRDIYWLFEEYKKSVSHSKRLISTFFYKYDLKKYEELVDIIYLPSLKMKRYIPINQNLQFYELPPGIDERGDYTKEPSADMKFFYVGGLGDLYQLDEFLKAVNSLEFAYLTICTRKDEWESLKDRYSPYLNDRINIIHEDPKGYEPFLKEADIGVLFVKPVEYRDFAVPVKLFEYIKYSKPILTVEKTAVGDFVEKHNIGWSLPYSSYELKLLLNRLYENRTEIDEKKKNTQEIIHKHTWKARALKVKEDLTK